MNDESSLLKYLNSLVGTPLPASNWRHISQEDLDIFALSTGDTQMIHTDSDYAKASGLDGTLAHGFYLLSLMATYLNEQMAGLKGLSMGLNYGLNKVRFTSPVLCGNKINIQGCVKHLEARPNGYLLNLAMHINIQGKQPPALVADWLVLLREKELKDWI
ncbi:MaoC family dehydratase [Shewanella corallii]|uniref:MaoC family dehydratase n=1 Tax=Shewanella corallii TaxID=560080 RepID=A0ABT0NAJ9_9GAMM|nr:MaoC/PaaZ C-terminal domain-containing protein [Shewanella corallii]MCL2915477.1 MaoC family dehydratase [Shewanella corallii]